MKVTTEIQRENGGGTPITGAGAFLLLLSRPPSSLGGSGEGGKSSKRAPSATVSPRRATMERGGARASYAAGARHRSTCSSSNSRAPVNQERISFGILLPYREHFGIVPALRSLCILWGQCSSPVRPVFQSSGYSAPVQEAEEVLRNKRIRALKKAEAEQAKRAEEEAERAAAAALAEAPQVTKDGTEETRSGQTSTPTKDEPVVPAPPPATTKQAGTAGKKKKR